MKPILTLIAFLTISYCSFSQLTYKAKAGLNLARLERAYGSFRGSDKDNQVLKPGFHAGGAIEYMLKKRLSIQAELIYSLKGMKETVRPMFGPVDSWDHSFHFHYVELPLLLRFSFDNNFKLGAGPSIAYMVKGKESLPDFYFTNRSLHFSRLDYGINADLSYAFRRFEIYARYNYGLKLVTLKGDRDAEISIGEEASKIGKNRTIQIGVAYLFK